MRCHQWHFSCSVQHLIIAEHGLHVCLEGMQGGEDKTHDWDSGASRGEDGGCLLDTDSVTVSRIMTPACTQVDKAVRNMLKDEAKDIPE